MMMLLSLANVVLKFIRRLATGWVLASSLIDACVHVYRLHLIRTWSRGWPFSKYSVTLRVIWNPNYIFFKKAPAIGDPWNLVYIYGVHIMWFEASEKPIFGFMSCWRDILNRYFNLFPHHTKIITNTAQRTPTNLFWTRAPIQDASSPYPRHLLFLLGRSKDWAGQAGHRGGVVYFWSTQDGPSHHHI